jgi:hypothetical protein
MTALPGILPYSDHIASERLDRIAQDLAPLSLANR